MAKLLDVHPDPAIVFTSDVPGLVAAEEILGPDPGVVRRLAACRGDDVGADRGSWR